MTVMPPVMKPGTYLRKRREADGIELEELALMLESTPAISARSRAELIAAVERDAAPVTEDLLRALLSARVAFDDDGQMYRVPAFPFDPVVLIKLMDHWALIQPSRTGINLTALNPTGAQPSVCAICACSEHDRCDSIACHSGFASWIGDLCGTCVERNGMAQAAPLASGAAA